VREKPYSCSNCGQQGHSRRTCGRTPEERAARRGAALPVPSGATRRIRSPRPGDHVETLPGVAVYATFLIE